MFQLIVFVPLLLFRRLPVVALLLWILLRFIYRPLVIRSHERRRLRRLHARLPVDFGVLSPPRARILRRAL